MMDTNQIPYISAKQMAEVDRLMVEEYGIKLIQMMENAGRHLAILAKNRFLGGDAENKQVVILAGNGGNGGGAMVCARNLLNWGAEVSVYLTREVDLLEGTIKHQGEILQRMDAQLSLGEDLIEMPHLDLIVDGIIGYSLQGAPRGRAADMINWANGQNVPILALDLPSGLNATTGEVLDPTIRAAATMTLALPKIGLKKAQKEVVGELYLADIGVPPGLYSRLPLHMDVDPLFGEDGILQVE
ncbi:MAG: NAD(P)H-hydrate epimerase [Anaerolineales bacterium]|nr:NAD(P)H-hydrate epimerase [Anaerolineales bacterium]